MTRRSVLALAAALTITACNKPSPEPSVAAPVAGPVDTVAAAGAPIADSAVVATDTARTTGDSTATTADRGTAVRINATSPSLT